MTGDAITISSVQLDPFRGVLVRQSRSAGGLLTTAAPTSAARPNSWASLTAATRIYVGTVAAFGAAAIVLSISQLHESASGLFTTLAVLSLITAFAKVNVPILGGDSTFTVCYVIDFTALVLLGVPYATLTTAAGVWTQCTFKCRAPSQLHQTWFSIGVLAITVQLAGFVYRMLGGTIGTPHPIANSSALAAAATVYFVTNSILVAAAVGLSSGQRIARLWWTSFAPMSREYLIGCTVAALAAASLARWPLTVVGLACSVIALTHRNLKAYAEGLSESNTDALTDLPNRRAVMARASQELARAERSQTPMTVMVVDLDRFKSINDTHGHRCGDVALQEVAGRLQASLRNYDVCARYGGDEFVLLLPGCGVADAAEKARVLRKALARESCELRPGVRVPLNVSIGTATFPEQGQTFEALFASADRAMYEDKRSKRLA